MLCFPVNSVLNKDDIYIYISTCHDFYLSHAKTGIHLIEEFCNNLQT